MLGDPEWWCNMVNLVKTSKEHWESENRLGFECQCGIFSKCLCICHYFIRSGRKRLIWRRKLLVNISWGLAAFFPICCKPEACLAPLPLALSPPSASCSSPVLHLAMGTARECTKKTLMQAAVTMLYAAKGSYEAELLKMEGVLFLQWKDGKELSGR